MNEQDSDNPHPLGLLGGGEHFIDIPVGKNIGQNIVWCSPNVVDAS